MKLYPIRNKVKRNFKSVRQFGSDNRSIIYLMGAGKNSRVDRGDHVYSKSKLSAMLVIS